MSDPDFVGCVQKIWDLLRYEVDRALKQTSPPGAGSPAQPQPRKSYFDA